MTYLIARSNLDALVILRKADVAIIELEHKIIIFFPSMKAALEFADEAWQKEYLMKVQYFPISNAILTIEKTSDISLEKIISDMGLTLFEEVL